MNRFIELNEAQTTLSDLIARMGSSTIVLTRDGQPIARLSPPEAAPDHRAKESRRGVTLAPEFEPADIRLDRMRQNGDVPHRLRRPSR